MVKMNFVSYDAGEDEKKLLVETVSEIKNIRVTYDGGRMSVYLNDKVLYTTFMAGNDFEIELKSE